MATATIVVTYNAASGTDGKKPVVTGITIDGQDLAAGRTLIEKRHAYFACKETEKQILRLGLLGLGASPDLITS